MSLNSIRESYSKLLTTFNDAGIKLSSNQKSDIDSFVLAVESSVKKQRELAIRKTKKAVTEKLEKEFKSVFESIMKNTSKNNILAAKIQDLNTKLNESKKIAEKVDGFLNLHVESVLPKKTIVDYDRMQKLEVIHESLKDLLVADDDAIKEAKTKLEESYKSQKSKCETEVAKMQVKLNESNKQISSLKKQLDRLEGVKLLESKTQNLPEFEARSVKKRLSNATVEEIKTNFKSVLESVKNDAKKIVEEKETTLDEEIENIINDDDIEENDMLTSDPHNGKGIHNAHLIEKDDEVSADDDSDNSKNEAEDDIEEEEEDFETMESIKFNEDGDIELDESDVIDANVMKRWCDQSIEVR